MRSFIFALPLVLIAAMPISGAADEPITITIKDHRFQPAEVKVPANTRVLLNVVNEDATPEEFESKPMKVEKVIAGNSKVLIRIGPLKPGRYSFVGEYHEDTAKGVVIAE